VGFGLARDEKAREAAVRWVFPLNVDAVKKKNYYLCALQHTYTRRFYLH
jgi:hypothetical protein